MRPIDPVKLREASVRANKRISASMIQERTTKALLWFHRHAVRKAGDADAKADEDALVLSTPLIVAAHSADREHAEKYVQEAYAEMRGAIVERAIALAQEDYAAAERELEK